MIVNNNVDLVYDGDTYTAFPFRFQLPDVKNDGSVSNAKITVSAVDQQLAGIIRSTATPITVKAIAVFYQDAAGTLTVESLAEYDLVVRNVSGNAEYISADLIYEERLELDFPRDEFRPSIFPGLF